jgi:hypothetical protein
MRYLLTALGLFTLAASPAEAATRHFGVSGFERIRVEGPYKVTISTGIAPFAKATGSQTAIDALSMTVTGRTLTIRPNHSGWGGYPGANAGAVEIAIGTHELSSVMVHGAAAVAIDKVKGLNFDLAVSGSGSSSIAAAKADRLNVTLVGPATATLAGSALSLTTVLRGSGGLDSRQLAVKDATITAEGSVSVAAAVSGTAKIQANGAAAVTLEGDPACSVRTQGAATVTGCR